MNTEQLEAILLHELAHIRRKDYLTNLVMITLRTLFFFNPFVGRLIRAMQEEREQACDEMVLAADYPAGSYAAALLQLERSRQSYGSFSLAASGVSHPLLLARIRKMHGLPVNSGTEKHFHSILPSLLLSLGAGFVLACPVKQHLTARQPLVAFPSNELQAVLSSCPGTSRRRSSQKIIENPEENDCISNRN